MQFFVFFVFFEVTSLSLSRKGSPNHQKLLAGTLHGW